MSKPLLALAAALLAPAAVRALPVPGYVYPSALQAGTSARIIVGGMFMRGVNGAVVSGDGVTVSKVTQVPGFPRAPGKTQVGWCKQWFYEILDGTVTHRELPPEATADNTDWPRCDWWANLDARDPLELEIICRFWHTPENYPQPTPALDQLVILDLDVAKDAKPGLRELIVHDRSSISAPHPFFITREPHIAEPSFVIPRGEQCRLRPPRVLHLPRKLPVGKPPVAFDGEVWPGEVDDFQVELKQGVRYTFETHARELLPYLGDAVPGFFNPTLQLLAPNGREVAFEDDFYYLPDPLISCVAPTGGVYTLKIADNLYRGRQDFVYTIRCFEDSLLGHSYTPRNRAFACYPPPASHLPPQAGGEVDVRTGSIDCPGRTVRNRFTVKEACTLQFELFARRNGSPLDGVLRLYGPVAPGVPETSAPRLAEWDDIDKFLAGTVPQAICDPRGAWTFLKPGEYCVTVSDREGCGGDHFDYTLAISKLRPDFEIYATRSTYLMKGDEATVAFKVVPLNGFTGPIRIESNDDFTCDYDIDSAAKEPPEVTVTARNSWSGLKLCHFRASAKLPDGTRIVRRITPTDPGEQAFAYTHLLPARAFFFYKP